MEYINNFNKLKKEEVIQYALSLETDNRNKELFINDVNNQVSKLPDTTSIIKILFALKDIIAIIQEIIKMFKRNAA